MCVSKKKYKIDCSECEYNFANSETVKDAAQVVLSKSLYHGTYQHYTTIDKVVAKIKTKRWYLTRLDSLSINDFHEAYKYSSREEARRTYIASFGHFGGESAAMWSLYGKNSPFACRVSLSKSVMAGWMNSIEGLNFGRRGESILVNLDPRTATGNKPVAVKEVCFRDVMYASVGMEDGRDDERANALSWDFVVCRKIDKEEVREEVLRGLYAGWIKDSEWRYEQESRLCIRLSKPIQDKAISIRIPDDVIRGMKFTLSPWSEKTSQACAENMIYGALQNGAFDDDNDTRKAKQQLFCSSTLHGALNFK